MTDPVVRERIVAIVPIRSFHNGKSRLAPVLDRAEREALLRQTAEGVIDAARRSGAVESVLIVSADDEVLSLASRIGAPVKPLAQSAEMRGLNGAIDAGRAWALEDGATAVLSLFADLPNLNTDDVRALTARPEQVVLGADRRGQGTNAMLLRLAGAGSAFRFAFGEGSLEKHLSEARRLGLATAVIRAEGLAFDLDTPEDWTEWLARRLDANSRADPVVIPCGAGAA